MRIAVMGTGGVGGYFGGVLARAGHDVTFIARGEHLQAIRQHGLRVQSVHGDFVITPAQATDDPATPGPVDLVLFATKTYQLEAAAQAMRPLVGAQTTVLPLQNGVDAAERTAAILGRQPVVGGLCYVGANIAAPGVIHQISQFNRIVVGELDGPVSPRVRAIADAVTAAGAVGEAADDIRKATWSKFIFIAPFSAVGAVTRVPAGEIRACAEARALVGAAIAEVEAVARGQGIALDADIAPKTLAFFDSLAPSQLASMQRDILAGRPSELESMLGVMLRRGAELGIPTPIFTFCYACLRPQEIRANSAPA